MGEYSDTVFPNSKWRKHWRKLLYLNQPFPDNYVDRSFLSQLKRNSTVVKYSYWSLVADFSLISLYITNLLLVALVFKAIYAQDWNNSAMLMVCTSTFIAGFYYWLTCLTRQTKEETEGGKDTNLSIKSNMKSLFLVVFMFAVLSPVLESLTKSTSSDSIWTLSFILNFMGTLVHDYAMDLSSSHYEPIFSANLALSNAMVLASRLKSSYEVFAFVLFAVEVSILFPLFDFSLRKQHMILSHYFIQIFISLVVYILLYYSAGIMALVACIFTNVTTTFVLPGYFLFLQKYKNELQGPWDTAKPIINVL